MNHSFERCFERSITCIHLNWISRTVVLDTVLQIAESLSLADDVAGQLADNTRLFDLACHVIRLSAKDEVRVFICIVYLMLNSFDKSACLLTYVILTLFTWMNL